MIYPRVIFEKDEEMLLGRSKSVVPSTLDEHIRNFNPLTDNFSKILIPYSEERTVNIRGYSILESIYCYFRRIK